MDVCTGEFDSLILPHVNTDCMQLLLNEVSACHPKDYIVMVIDGADGHRSDSLKAPANIYLLKLPPSAPELNPIEHSWDELRAKCFHNHALKSLDALEDQLAIASDGYPNPPRLATSNSPTLAIGCVSSDGVRLRAPCAFIDAQLRLTRNYTVIYQDLVDTFGFIGAYNSVKRVAGGLGAHEPEQFDRLEFAPGEEAQVIYGEVELTRVVGSRRDRMPRLFVMTLRYSRCNFRRVDWKSSLEVWTRLHEEAWRYFGGACLYVVRDNLKEGMIKPNLYEPQRNAVYASHAGALLRGGRLVPAR